MARAQKALAGAGLPGEAPWCSRRCAADESTRPSDPSTPWSFRGISEGQNWSGAAFDPEGRRPYVNVNELPLVAALGSESGRTPAISHYRRFVDGSGWPCVKPPWGALIAVDLQSGRIAWKSPLGTVERLQAGSPTGLPSWGGAIATAGGLAFIAGTTDRQIRAFDASTGKELWRAELDASGHATPATYFSEQSNRQFVVIAAGGGGYLSPEHVSNAIVAFALPRP